jgi:uncharacterized protein
MRLVINQQAVAVVQLPAGSRPPDWAVGDPLVSVTSTAEETSIVCPTYCLPDDLPGSVEGPLVAVHVVDHVTINQVGVLVSLLQPLAAAGISVLTVSTFNTDWILIPAAKAAAAASVWRAAGHDVIDAAIREVL